MSNQYTASTNIQAPDLSNSRADARKYFNNFYATGFNVSASANDAMIGFFENQTGDTTAGKLLAAAVINTALQQNENPLTVFDQFKKMNPGELNVYLALYLNLSRVNSSLLGIKNVPQTSKYVQRNIIV